MIKISGLDDDVVQIESDKGSIDVPVSIEEAVIVTAQDKEGGVEVSAWFEGPCWAFTFMQLPGDGDVELPWDIKVEQDSPYSMVIEIQCPEDTEWDHTVDTQ